jgi:NitT/TauT family transport system substrate-binding protein
VNTNRKQLTRRQFLAGTFGLASMAATGGFVVSCAPAPSAQAPDKVVWVTPRGTLDVMDDYNMWVSQKLGYFKDNGLEVELQGGPTDGSGHKLVSEGQADVGYPSPGVLLSGIDAGMPLIMAWEMMMRQVFDFALPENSPVNSVKDLEGKTIALGSEGWIPIVDPILVEAGVDPKSVNYVNVGPQWGQAVALGQADAALAWRGLQTEWAAAGMKLKFLVGKTFSNHPANGYVVKRADLNDPTRRDMMDRFFKAVAMGLHFGRTNPQAAAQITYEALPAVREKFKDPQMALDSMWELGGNYFDGDKMGKGYGYSDLDGWNSYIDTIYELGQIKTRHKTEDVVTNELIADANKFDRAKVEADAKNYAVNDQFKNLVVNEM